MIIRHSSPPPTQEQTEKSFARAFDLRYATTTSQQAMMAVPLRQTSKEHNFLERTATQNAPVGNLAGTSHSDDER